MQKLDMFILPIKILLTQISKTFPYKGPNSPERPFNYDLEYNH